MSISRVARCVLMVSAKLKGTMMNCLNRIQLSALVAMCLSACGSQQPRSLDDVPSIQTDAKGWTIQVKEDRGQGIRLERSTIPENQLNEVRRDARQTALIAFPVEGHHNVNAFLIKARPEWEKVVFIAPQIMAFSSADGGRLYPKKNADGTVTLSFPVAFIDGSRAKIESPSGAYSELPISPLFLIQDLPGLRSEARADLGFEPRIAPLPGCPRRIVLSVQGQEFDATPSDLSAGDYCQINRPFSVSVKLEQAEARQILEQSLYAGAVEVRAVFETAVPVAVGEASLSFDKEKLFNSLATELKISGGFWLSSDLKSNVTKIVKSQTLKLRLQGEADFQLETIVNQAIAEFFRPFEAIERAKIPECSNARICMTLNFNYSRETETFQVSWKKTSNELTGQRYNTFARLAPLDDKSVQIGEPQGYQDCTNRTCRPMLMNHGASIETGLTVSSGDLLEITPQLLRREIRSVLAPQVQVSHQVVCTERRRSGAPRCRRRGADHDCIDVPEPTYCAKTEDQWTKVTDYSLSAAQFEDVVSPVGQLSELFEGLKVRFTWSDGLGVSRSQDCALKSFVREGNGRSLMVRLEDQPSCSIFRESLGRSVMLHLMNDIQSPLVYRSGRDVVMWDGRVVQSSTLSEFTPEVSLSAAVTIRGYGFGVSGARGIQ